ncbi:ribosomal protein L37AE/L43A [Bacillus mesophilus]|uniref:NERD domain-containing protein n=1 Tax=Bacillus mesophilus TaxID=1808955 RepID=A0A6M0Q9K5_9BACI|nr:nuclease-related domain-containing protein [Bacillus mesophilus]MBM7662390.1 ribosomal protein L37AE/L43A [Bacillus mesophilus]NEY72983.1 NERD domain-containing protein [Bacillus mesophilus]
MIKKTREIPLIILKLQALLRRLPPSHPKRPLIQEDLAKYLAGFKGEQAVDYYLSFLPQDNYQIFHGLRLQLGTHFFQMDILFLSPKFILICEVKNIAGTILFDSQFNQLIRSINEIEEGFQDPILQVKRQQLQLKEWLNTNQVPTIPIETLVVFSNPQTIIKTLNTNSSQVPKKVIHSTFFPFKIEEYEKIYKTSLLTNKELKKLTSLLLKRHTPYFPNLHSQYDIQMSEILKGVECTNCFSIPMTRKNGIWHCPYCCSTSKTAHNSALIDYSLLISPTITNKECREFLNLPSRNSTFHLLQSMNFSHDGTTKGRKYFLPTT